MCWPAASRWFEGLPLPLVEDGKPLQEHMDKARVDESEILAAARITRGLETMDDIRHAQLENDGKSSIIVREPMGTTAHTDAGRPTR
ncbi:MAG TPA: YetF domain-containing protein [Lysobacter sp.]|nr:YetF domain-containing protein [Lysobacter sp.]